MRRSLARCAIALTSARVARRSARRSVSRTQLLAWRKAGVGMSCNMGGLLERQLLGCCACPGGTRETKKAGRFPASPLEPFLTPPVQQDPADSNYVHRLFGSLRHRNHRYESAAIAFCAKLDATFDLGEESMVSAHADIKAGMPGGAALTRDDVAGNHMLATVGLDPKALAR